MYDLAAKQLRGGTKDPRAICVYCDEMEHILTCCQSRGHMEPSRRIVVSLMKSRDVLFNEQEISFETGKLEAGETWLCGILMSESAYLGPPLRENNRK